MESANVAPLEPDGINTIELEKQILSAMINSWDTACEIVKEIDSDCFLLFTHQGIFNSIRRTVEDGNSINQSILVSNIKSRGIPFLECVGGEDYIAELANLSPIVEDTKSLVIAIKKNAILRELIDTTSKVKKHIDTVTDHLSNLDLEDVLAIRPTKTAQKKTLPPAEMKKVGEVMRETLIGHALLALQNNKRQKIPTGFIEIDELIGGLYPGSLTVLAARTSVGRTALSLNIAANAAERGAVVYFVSLERV